MTPRIVIYYSFRLKQGESLKAISVWQPSYQVEVSPAKLPDSLPQMYYSTKLLFLSAAQMNPQLQRTYIKSQIHFLQGTNDWFEHFAFSKLDVPTYLCNTSFRFLPFRLFAAGALHFEHTFKFSLTQSLIWSPTFCKYISHSSSTNDLLFFLGFLCLSGQIAERHSRVIMCY